MELQDNINASKSSVRFKRKTIKMNNLMSPTVGESYENPMSDAGIKKASQNRTDD